MPDDTTGNAAGVVSRARQLAAGVFAPAAMGVEASQQVPPEHLDLLAAEGFYGLAGPREAGGLDVPFPAACRVIEILAGACLSTTFVWMQHHGVVRAVAGGPGPLRREMLGPLCRGERRAGVALAGLLPGPPRLRARAAEGRYVLDGTSPWVTGWGYIDSCTSPPAWRTTRSCGPCSTPARAPHRPGGPAPGPGTRLRRSRCTWWR